MKLKNTTNSTRELMDKSTGKIIKVKPWAIIELEKCLYDKNTFKIVVNKPVYIKKRKKRTEKTITEKEVKN